MALIDSARLAFFLRAVQTAKRGWEAARETQQATDRHDRSAWIQAEAQSEQTFAVYNEKARDLTPLPLSS